MNASLGRYWQQEGVADATAAKEHLSLRGLVRHLRWLFHSQLDDLLSLSRDLIVKRMLLNFKTF